MLKELVTPAKASPVFKNFSGNKELLGHQILHTGWNKTNLPDAVILGIADDRDSDSTFAGSSEAIREQLYQLNSFSDSFRIFDLGDVITGKERADTLAAVQLIAEEIHTLGIPLLFLGGNQSFTVPLLAGMNKNNAVLTVVDDRLDNLPADTGGSYETYLNKLSSETIINLIGLQSFFVSPSGKESFAETFTGSQVTLGELRAGIEEMEPYLRETDLVSFDFGALKLCEAPGQIRNSPNGLTGEEACQISWYAGISTNPVWFSLFGYCPARDTAKTGAMMAAQIAWYFLLGKSKKMDETPVDEAIDFMHFVVQIDGIADPVTFLKHPVSRRWWMEVPSPDCDLFPLRIPCSKKDYKKACKNEIPDRWWSFFNKNY